MGIISKRFGWIASGEDVGPDALSDVPVLTTEDAVVLPTLGSIVPKWVLVVPRACAISLAALPADLRAAIVRAADQAERAMSPEFPAVFFEHGPSKVGSVVGCSVDQAHLHVVCPPAGFVKSALGDPNVEWVSSQSADPWDGLEGKEYYLIKADGIVFIGYPRVPVSQFFRRHMAAAAGVPDRWDYKTWPNYENIRRTYEQFEGCVRADAS